MLLSLLLIFTAAVFSIFLPESLKKVKGYILAVVPAWFFIYFLRKTGSLTGDNALTEIYGWMPEIGVNINLYLDGLSLLFALLILGIGVFVIIFSNDYMKSYSDTKKFYFFMLFFMGAMLGLVFSANLIILYLFWELTSISSFFLIGFFHKKEESRNAAIQALLVTALGGLALLTGIILLGQVAGSYDLTIIFQNREQILSSPHYTTILLLFLAGILTKSAQFPFHFWLPGAMQAPSPVSAYLHSATMVKAGVFLLFRMSSILGGTDQWVSIVTLFGVVTMFSGAYLAVTRTDLKAILAFTTVSALGILTLLIGLDTQLSVKAAILFLVIHSLYKATLFMVAGAIQKKTGTRNVRHLGGLFKRMPVTATAAIISLLSMSGLPPMLGFIGKELIYEAKVQLGGLGDLVLILGVLSNVFLVWVSGLIAYRVFFGKERKGLPRKMEPSFSLLAGPVLLSLSSLLLGLAPGMFGEMIVEPALIASRIEILEVKLKLWHGFNLVFFLSLTTVVTGILFFFMSPRLIPVLRRINDRFFSYNFSDAFFRLIGNLLLFARKNTQIVQHGYHRIYLIIIFLFSASLIFYQLVKTWGWEISANFSDMPFYVIAIAAVISISAIFVMITGSRMAAIVLLGVTGYGIGLIFLIYGGIDLAITQIIVETLLLILFVLVVWKLPKFRKLSSGITRIRDLIVAVFLGAVITGVTLKADFLNLSPSISQYFIEKSWPEAFGKNVVNVILVDFRALDTLGEITVLTLAAVGVLALLKMKIKE